MAEPHWTTCFKCKLYFDAKRRPPHSEYILCGICAAERSRELARRDEESRDAMAAGTRAQIEAGIHQHPCYG